MAEKTIFTYPDFTKAGTGLMDAFDITRKRLKCKVAFYISHLDNDSA